MSLEEFMRSLEARFALRYALILFVGSVVDAVVLVLESVYGVAPESYREAVLLAGEKGILSYRTASRLARLASLRSMLVHRYWRVDDERLYRETGKGLGAARRALEELERYGEALPD